MPGSLNLGPDIHVGRAHQVQKQVEILSEDTFYTIRPQHRIAVQRRSQRVYPAQVELRQHIWWRLGFAAWAGTGTVFPSFSAFSTSAILPNYGLGLRFEFKHRMNIRIDYGFGKGTSGLVVQFAEAF